MSLRQLLAALGVAQEMNPVPFFGSVFRSGYLREYYLFVDMTSQAQ